MNEVKSITACIIDDMKLARESLKADLAEHCPSIILLGEADGVLSGMKLLNKFTPDILFLDIELEDGIGFDIIELLGDKLQSKVIFTTASNEYAIRAFQVSAIDYLLKPIQEELLVAAVQKTQEQSLHSKAQLDLLTSELKSSTKSEKLALHTQDKIVVSNISEIVRCESSGNYTTFYFREIPKLMVTKTLKEYDELLSGHGFIRTHQSHLINAQLIKEFVKTEGGYIMMKDDSRIPVSVRKRAEVLKLIEDI